MARSVPSSRRGLWLIVSAATLWGTTGVATQAIYDLSSTNPLSVTFLRLAIAALVLLLLCWRLGRRACGGGRLREPGSRTLAPVGRSRARVWQVKRRDALLMLCIGTMQATSQYCYFAAIAACGVTIATLITICVAPVIVVLLAALFLRERVTRNILLALVCAVAGTALLTGTPAGKETFGSLLAGVFLSLVSAAAYAIVILIGRVLSSRYHSLQVNAASFGSGSLVLLGCSLVTPLVLNYPAAGWLLLLYMGCIPTALAYGLFQVGIRSTSATLTSILTFCEPLTAAILAWLLFGEHLSPPGILGALLLLGTIGLLALAESTPGTAI